MTNYTDREWIDQAACVGTDLELWFSTELHDIDKAQVICASCPVAAKCLAAALEIDPTNDFGILAGTTPLERRRLRRRAEKPKAAQCVRGHNFDQENSYLNARGVQICRACKRLKGRQHAQLG
jgi:chromosome segregation and condensation protein ScpB